MNRLRWLFRRRNADRDLSREIDAHMAERVDDLVEDGLSEAEARTQARREFGNRTLQVESSREVWRWRWLDVARASLRDAVRTFRRSAGTVTTCLLVLGASTGLFVTAVVIADALVLRPIRLPSIDRVVSMGGLTEPGLGWTFNEWWGQAGAIEKLAQLHAGLVELSTNDGRFLVNAGFAEPAFPELFPIRALQGRTLGADDFQAGTPVPVVINETIWETRFKRDATVIGATVAVADVPVVIVGVLPRLSAFPHDVQIWIPRSARDARALGIVAVRHTRGGLYARLIEDATIDDAQRDIQALGTRLNAEHTPKTGVVYFGIFSLKTLADWVASPFRLPVLALLIGTGAVLIMATANAATLLLGLVLDRRQELAVRASLGAARRRLVAQIGLESILIGASAGALGGLASVVLLRVTAPLVAPATPLLDGGDAAQTVMHMGIGLGSVLGLVVGLVPLFFSLAWRDWSLLAHHGRERGSGRGRRTRSVLVVVQVSAAMMLLTGAGVSLRTFLSSGETDLGFDASHVLGVRFVVPTGTDAMTIVETISRGLTDSGGASAVAAAQRLPIVDEGGMRYVGHDGTTPTREMGVGPGFFTAMGISLLAGRDFDSLDDRGTIVSETLGARLWPDGQSPLGRMLQVSPTDVREIVGVVPDIRHELRTADVVPGLGNTNLYRPLTLLPPTQPRPFSVVIQCAVDCASVVPRAKSIVEAAGTTVMEIVSLEDAVAAQLAPTRIRSAVATIYAAFALLLSIAGIYGAVRHVAAARTQEVTIRMALGATPSQARAIVLRYGAAIVIVGAAAGGGLAWWLLSLSESLLYGVTSADPMSYIVAAAALVAGGLLATLGPALRLGRLDVRRLLSE